MSAREKIDAQRRRLNRAHAVVTCAVVGVEYGVDPEIVGDALRAAAEMIDAAVHALDSTALPDAARTP